MNEKGDMVTDFRSILARWRNHFSQLLNVYGIKHVRKTDIYVCSRATSACAECLWGLDSHWKAVKTHVTKYWWDPSRTNYKAGDRTIHSEIHKLINSIWNKEELPEEWRGQSLYLFIRRAIKQAVVIIEAYHFCQLHTKFYPASCCQV
jgi:hypothetical protein